jgi:tRNA modification GTPase
VALRGPVNAGKSSLLNALVGARRALVSPEAGTTRDVIEARLILEGMELHLLDTAGLRAEAEGIEAEGIALGEALTAAVDLTVVVLPLHRPLDPASRALLAATAATARLVVGTHADLPQQAELAVDVAVCNPTGDGLPALRDALAQRLRRGPRSHGAQAQVISARQAALLGGVAAEAERAIEALSGVAGPAVAVQALHDALLQLAELVGQDPREEVLDRLFARFCIGK